MPNPTKPLTTNMLKRMSKRQKSMVRNLKENYGINPSQLKVYRRKNNGRSQLSVHNPIMDAKRLANKGREGSASKYPQARDTSFQRRHVRKNIPKGKKTGRVVGSKKGKSMLARILNP